MAASAMVLGAGSFVIVLALVPLVRRVALLHGITDQPAPTKVHTLPTPCLGGVAIVVAALGTSGFLSGWREEAAVILLGALLVSTVGLIDDVRMLDPRPRLVVEAVAAVAAAAVGARVHLTGGPLDWVITVAWLVVVTNSFNLLDNVDGAASTIAAVLSTALAVAALLEGQVLVGSLAAVLAGSSLGFLVYNRPPASIFMGDAGSLFVGYLLAVIALKLRFPTTRQGGITAVLLLTGPALFDTTLVVLSRVRAGRPLYVGGKDHTAHRLLRAGLSANSVAPVLALATSVSATLGLAVGRDVLAAGMTLGSAGLVGVVLLLLLLKVEVYPPSQPLMRAPAGVELGPRGAG